MRRILVDHKGQPIRDGKGQIIRTKPNTKTGAMVVPIEKGDDYGPVDLKSYYPK